MAWPKRKQSQADLKAGGKPVPSPLLQKLVRKLEALPSKDALRIRAAEELEQSQSEGAEQLFAICRSFVDTLNSLQDALEVELSPPAYRPDMLDAASPAPFQINASGRIVQLSLLPRESDICTDGFRFPYVLRGAMRWFNQELLDRHLVEEHQLFYCRERDVYRWVYYNPRTRKTGPVDVDYLAESLEELL